MRGKPVPPDTTPLSKLDMVPTSTIWYHPKPLKVRPRTVVGEMVIHLTSTTANSRRIGVIALVSGRRWKVPLIGHSRSRHSHGGKHPSSYVERPSLYGVMSDAGTG